MAHIIELHLDGEKISSDKLRRSISAFYGLIDEIALQVIGKKRPIKWIVSVEKGSAVFINKPELDGLAPPLLDNVCSSLDQGIESIEYSAERPKYFSDKALEYVQDLASIPEPQDGLNKINIIVDKKPHILTHHAVANIDTIMATYGKALGSVEGRLSTISERGGLKIVVYDRLTDKPVRCHIHEDMLEEVTKAFGKRVYIFGMISYGKDKFPKSISVEEIKVFPEKENIPSAQDVLGILRD